MATQAALRARQAANRLRRLARPAPDESAAVEIEGARPPRRRGRRRWRALRFALGFMVTFALLSWGLAAVAAWDARVPPDWSVVDAPPLGGPAATAAALLEVAPRDARDLGAEVFFLPTGRRDRADAYQAGAARAVAAFAGTLRDPQGRLAPVSALAERSDPEALRAARAALERRIGERAGRFDAARFSMLAQIAQEDVAAHAAALEALAGAGRLSRLSEAAQDAFFQSRGAALAWRALLAVSTRELGAEDRLALAPALAEADAMLREAAEHQPLFLFNPPPGARLWPPHVARQAERMRLAAEAAARLAQSSQLQADGA